MSGKDLMAFLLKGLAPHKACCGGGLNKTLIAEAQAEAARQAAAGRACAACDREQAECRRCEAGFCRRCDIASLRFKAKYEGMVCHVCEAKMRVERGEPLPEPEDAESAATTASAASPEPSTAFTPRTATHSNRHCASPELSLELSSPGASRAASPPPQRTVSPLLRSVSPPPAHSPSAQAPRWLRHLTSGGGHEVCAYKEPHDATKDARRAHKHERRAAREGGAGQGSVVMAGFVLSGDGAKDEAGFAHAQSLHSSASRPPSALERTGRAQSAPGGKIRGAGGGSHRTSRSCERKQSSAPGGRIRGASRAASPSDERMRKRHLLVARLSSKSPPSPPPRAEAGRSRAASPTRAASPPAKEARPASPPAQKQSLEAMVAAARARVGKAAPACGAMEVDGGATASMQLLVGSVV